MSLILDALNKADREREGAPVPNLNTHHAPGRGIDPRWYYALAALAALLLALCVFLVVMIVRISAETSAGVESTEVKPAQDAAGTKPEVVVVEQPVVNPATVRIAPPTGAAPALAVTSAEPDSSIAALYQTNVSQELRTIQEPQVRSREPERAAPAPSTVDAALAKALWDQSNIRYTPPPQPKPKVQPEAQVQAEGPPPAEGETLAGYADVPFLHNLSASVQNTIPTLMYANHNYPEGYVLINKTQVQEGDTLAEQLTVYKILADGVVFQFGDRQFKLSALNSWVNF